MAGDGGDTCLSGVVCLGVHEGWSREMPGLQAQPPQAGSASGFGWGRGSGRVLRWGGLSIPRQRPWGTTQAPPCPAPVLGEPNSPKSLCKHPAVPAPRHRQVPALAPPSSWRTLHREGWWGSGRPHLSAPPTILPHEDLPSAGTRHGDTAPRDLCKPGHLGPTDPAAAPSRPRRGPEAARSPARRVGTPEPP